MKAGRFVILALAMLVFCAPAFAAYHHEGEHDSGKWLAVYPAKKGTKLDHCALCHTGGQVGKYYAGSCMFCHATYGYDGAGDIQATLNPYGLAYYNAGRNEAAVAAIANTDSDGDAFSNIDEINALSYPGDAADDPILVPAPYRVYTIQQLQSMAQHSQFLLMNASRSQDFYAEYSGVILEDLLNDAGVLPGATNLRVYAPDGWAQDHPMDGPGGDNVFPVRGEYPQAAYHYDPEADVAQNPADGWCSYASPSCADRQDGDVITIPDGRGLRNILAFKRDGAFMDPGVLNQDNKLDGEGPFRVVPPQWSPSPPDQSSRAANQDVVWPYEETWDHNSGSSTRSVTIMKVEPLPAGTTDINVYEAGWDYVDRGLIIIYGAIDDTDSNGDGIYDSEEGANADPKRTRFYNAMGRDQIQVDVPKGQLKKVRAMLPNDPSIPDTNRPAMSFPYGAFAFNIEGLTPGETVDVLLTFGAAIPEDACLFKINPATGWHQIPIKARNGNTVTVSLTDGDPLTDADGVADGTITDPSALGVPAAAGDDGNAAGGSSSSSSGVCFIKALLGL